MKDTSKPASSPVARRVLTGSRSELVFRPLPQDGPKQHRPDIGLAERGLGWRPKVALRGGLARTIVHFGTLARAGFV